MSIYDHNVQTVDAVADIVDVLPVSGQLVQTLGYYAPSDGGGNLYRYEAGNVDTCDGGLVVDGPGGDNSPASAASTYPGISIAGRYIAVDQTSITAEQFGANLGDAGDAFRVQAAEASEVWDSPILNREGAADPTTTELPYNRDAAFYHQTTEDKIYIAINKDGTIKKIDFDGGGSGLTNWEETGFDFGPAVGNTTGNLTVPGNLAANGGAHSFGDGSATANLTLHSDQRSELFWKNSTNQWECYTWSESLYLEPNTINGNFVIRDTGNLEVAKFDTVNNQVILGGNLTANGALSEFGEDGVTTGRIDLHFGLAAGRSVGVGCEPGGGNNLNFYTPGGTPVAILNTAFDGGGLRVISGGHLGFSANATAPSSPGQLDAYFSRIDAGHIGMQDGVNPQLFSVYNDYTDASNYERGGLAWSGNALVLKAEASGTGVQRDLHISSLPTSNPGPGILWNNAGTPAIGT